MRLEKTEKARDELHGSQRRLGRRERTLLILADGHKTLGDIALILKDDARPLAEGLIRDGYLTGISLTPVATLASGPEHHQAAAPTFKPTITQAFETLQEVNADNFEGKRSLATTRMFLFDICERMFSRRAPEQAQAFREAFRNAKDRESMLATAREMMQAIEEMAGPERADSISQRIAMLLPVQP
jgi:hypothetical protein